MKEIYLSLQRISEHIFSVGPKFLWAHRHNFCDIANLFYFSATAFFLEGAPSTCCGTLSNFEFYAKATGTMLVQVWRSGSAENKYTLIAQETITGTELAFTKKKTLVFRKHAYSNI